jgi:ankyrin repeat protein
MPKLLGNKMLSFSVKAAFAAGTGYAAVKLYNVALFMNDPLTMAVNSKNNDRFEMALTWMKIFRPEDSLKSNDKPVLVDLSTKLLEAKNNADPKALAAYRGMLYSLVYYTKPEDCAAEYAGQNALGLIAQAEDEACTVPYWLDKLLLAHTSGPHPYIDSGNTPALITAAKYNHLSTALVLLAHGANPELVDEHGLKAADYFAQHGNQDKFAEIKSERRCFRSELTSRP